MERGVARIEVVLDSGQVVVRRRFAGRALPARALASDPDVASNLDAVAASSATIAPTSVISAVSPATMAR
jgi:hypothetical protein